MKRSFLALTIVIAALTSTACCRLNRMPEWRGKLDRVAFQVRVEEMPTVYFTHASLRMNRTTGPSHNFSENRFDQVLQAFGPQEVAASLTRQVPRILAESLGWEMPADGLEADADLEVYLQNYCFRAKDALSGVEIAWQVQVVLVDASSGETIWRDCVEWTTADVVDSMRSLAESEPERLAEVLDHVTRDLMTALAGRLAEQRYQKAE